MATRKKKEEAPLVDVPQCKDCRAGVFEPGEKQGSCHLFPMEWVSVDDDLQATHRPAVADDFCLQFIRKVH